MEIEILEYLLGKLQAQLKAANGFISDVSSEIVTLISSANNTDKQLQTLNGKEEELRTSRSEET